jgi:hypothetical protein|tara:strand:- start:109 stop:1101 length:993 start_codon:yes stop_codon:yes gene_type:complete
MKSIWNWIINNPNRAMFLVPILLVATISISHVVTWYDMSNPISWAIYLSIAIEIGAMSALVAATNKIKGGVWFMFGLVTFIQMIGNIFYSYVQIDATGELFRNWVELTGPVWEMMGTELSDIIGLKRYLAFLEGGLLPLISLTSLHFFVNYEKEKEKVVMSVPDGMEFNKPYPIPNVDDEVDDEPFELVDYSHLEKPTSDTPKFVDLDPLIKQEEEFDEEHALDMVMNDMVEEIMEEEGHETVGELIESLNEDKEVDLTQFVSPGISTKEIDNKEESITEEVVTEIEENSIDTQDIIIEEELVKETPQIIENVVVDNKPPNKRMGIDRIR